MQANQANDYYSISNARVNQGISIEAAAEHIGVPVRVLDDYEKSPEKLPIYMAVKLVCLYNEKINKINFLEPKKTSL